MLAELQTDFIQTIKQRQLTSFAAALNSSEVSAAERMHVYANHLGLTLRELLTSAYPKLAEQLGEDEFTRICVSYCRQRPMQVPSAWCFGDGFADVLATDAEYAAEQALVDLARIERAAQQCFYAAEEEPLPVDALSGLDADALCQVRFYLLPAVQLLEADSQALGYWQMAESLSLPVQQFMPDQSVGLLIRRLSDGDIGVTALSADLFLFLQLLIAGNDFMTTYAAVLEQHPDFVIQDAYQYCMAAEIFSNQSG